jgi:hypothetical protein
MVELRQDQRVYDTISRNTFVVDKRRNPTPICIYNIVPDDYSSVLDEHQEISVVSSECILLICINIDTTDAMY